MVTSPRQVIGRLWCSALAASSLLIFTHSVQAGWSSQGQIIPIYNDFEDGDADFGDGFPSVAIPPQGWNSAWTAGFSAGAQVRSNTASANPLNDTPTYLSVSWSNTTSAVAVRRQITTYSQQPGTGPSSTNYNPFDVSYSPTRLKFDFRVDSFTGKVFTNQQNCVTNYVTCTNGTLCTTSSVYADPPVGYTVTTNTTCTNVSVFAYYTNNWSSPNDNIFIHASNGSGTSPGNASAFVIFVQGGASAVNGPAGPANRWLVYEGNVAGTAQGSGAYFDTGMAFAFNTVYHFEVINDPREKTYRVKISDGATTNTTGWLRWRAWSDLAQVTTRSVLHWGGTLNDTNSQLAFSVDSISVDQLEAAAFPPFISQLRPSAIQPFTPKINPATPSGAGVPPMNFIPDYDTPEFWPASRGITFAAGSGGGGSNDYSGGTYGQPGGLMATARATVPTNGIGLVLNGVDVSSGLVITTPYGPNYRKVAYNGLVPNTFYTGMISVTNSLGAVKQTKLAFNTLDEDFNKVIEAEDYNYSDGGYTRSGSGSAPTVGGMFLDNPAPSDFTNNAYINQGSGYVDKMGYTTGLVATIDYFVPNNNFGAGGPTNFNIANNVYRIADAVGTTVALDFRRAKYNTSGARDFQVNNIRPLQWMNYSRTFAAGTYNFYLRASSTSTSGGGTNAVRLDYVTSDPTQPSQTTTNIGIFLVPYTGNAQVFTNTPLLNTNVGGTVLAVTLPAGVHTLRLTCLNAGNNLQLNYLIAAPASGSAPTVAITSPANGASFGSGANISLTATASGASTVTYYSGTTAIGSSSSGPTYPVTWNSVPTGNYSIIAKATAGGFTAKSAPVRVKVGSPGKSVLYVMGGKAGDIGAVDGGNLGTGDAAKHALLTSLGWTVTDLYSTNLAWVSGFGAANAGFDMIMVSCSVQASDVNQSFRDASVPYWNEESGGGLMNGMSVAKDNALGLDFGASGSRGTFILPPYAVGLPGTAGLQAGTYALTATVTAANLLATVNENGNILLTGNFGPSDTLAAFVWYYPAGAEMWNGIIAPATRYGWWNAVNDGMVTVPMNATGTNLMIDGLNLTMSNPGFSGVTIYQFAPSLSGSTVTIPFRGASYEETTNYVLYSAGSAAGPFTNDTTAVITKPDPNWNIYEASTTIKGPTMIYRVRRANAQ